MKLMFFRGTKPNFGDELNEYMWHRVLPENFLDEDASEMFIGIGSILHAGLYPKGPKKYVMGSGYAGYGNPPEVDADWTFLFVRGPRTAAALSLPKEKVIADAAVLLRVLEQKKPNRDIPVAFMPHYESLERGLWPKACALAGIHLIDPTGDIDDILDQIRRSKVLLTEAMHGAIVADALRTPWVALKPIYRGHHFKWMDWAEALGINLRQSELMPTSLLEAYIKRTGRGAPDGMIGRVSQSPLSRPLNAILTHQAARHLQKLSKVEPQMSTDSAISRATERAMDVTTDFARKHASRGLAAG